MVNWQSPQTAEQIRLLGYRLALVCLGVYGWDMLTNLWFEGWLLRRVIPFKWIYVPYFLGRYSLLVAMLLAVAITSPPAGTRDCIVTDLILPLMALISLGCASLILLICATTALKAMPWSQLVLRRAKAPLFLLACGHWVVILTLAFRAKGWEFKKGTCGVQELRDLVVLYIYTILYDGVVLVLSASALRRVRSGIPLADILLKQGVGYFLVTFVANLVSGITIFTMPSVLAQSFVFIPAVTISMMASSRVVTKLLAMENGCACGSQGSRQRRTGSRVSARAEEGQLTTNLPMHFLDTVMSRSSDSAPESDIAKYPLDDYSSPSTSQSGHAAGVPGARRSVKLDPIPDVAPSEDGSPPRGSTLERHILPRFSHDGS